MKGQRRGEAGRARRQDKWKWGGGGRSCDPSDGTAASTSNSLKTKKIYKDDVLFSLSIFWRSEGGYEKNGTAL